ncbi:MAG: general secretion pathway protein GspK [Sandaracinaceae bacterium]|nr:general secretion pathway protein GspK [Sandaracinaceae bacterium]
MTTATSSALTHLPALAGSTDSRARAHRPLAHGDAAREPRRREKGVALIVVSIAIVLLAIVLAEMHETTATSFALATTQRDRVRAEYLARSGVNLTRMLIANEPQIRAAVQPLIGAMLGGRRLPQLPIWSFANEILEPFCNYEAAQAERANSGIDFSAAAGLGDAGGTCDIVAFAENSKLNLNSPLHMPGDPGRLNVAMQVFAMTGGYQAPSPYDPLFERRDGDGLITTRLDIISALVDWWDYDTQRTVFDPGAGRIDSNSGAEDSAYSNFRDPYEVKNAPFDSLEELRLIRGVGDDFWATFVEPDPDDPTTRTITIYGSGRVHLNEARAEVLLARTCSIIPMTSLCTDPGEAAKFITVINTARALAPIPWFSNVNDYIEFLRGGGTGMALRPMLESIGLGQGLLPAPVQIDTAAQQQMGNVFLTSAAIIFVQSTGRVGGGCNEEIPEEERGPGGCTAVRVRSVLNFDTPWTPPPPNAGMMTPLGIFHYWRLD